MLSSRFSLLRNNSVSSILSRAYHEGSGIVMRGVWISPKQSFVLMNAPQCQSSSLMHTLSLSPPRFSLSESKTNMLRQQNAATFQLLRSLTETTSTRIRTTVISIVENLLDNSIWYIKRTFQPSIIRKKRKQGFLQRHKTVGGRRVLKRRIKKGRMRLA